MATSQPDSESLAARTRIEGFVTELNNFREHDFFDLLDFPIILIRYNVATQAVNLKLYEVFLVHICFPFQGKGDTGNHPTQAAMAI